MTEASPRPWSNQPGDGRVYDANGKLVLMAINPEKESLTNEHTKPARGSQA